MSKRTHWPQDISDLHVQFGFHSIVEQLPRERLLDFLAFRLKFLREELVEGETALAAQNPEEIVDALIDLCVVAVGTLDLLAVDVQKAWDCVRRANMLKEPGVKSSRPNPFGFPDLIKPAGWTPPDHSKNLGLLVKLLYE